MYSKTRILCTQCSDNGRLLLFGYCHTLIFAVEFSPLTLILHCENVRLIHMLNYLLILACVHLRDWMKAKVHVVDLLVNTCLNVFFDVLSFVVFRPSTRT